MTYTVNIYENGSGSNNGDEFETLEQAKEEGLQDAISFLNRKTNSGRYEFSDSTEITIEDEDGEVYERIYIRDHR